MNEKIKPATPNEVAEKKKTVKPSEKDKNVELANELNVKKKELKQSNLILNGGVNESGQKVPSCDKLQELGTKKLEMKEIEMQYGQVTPGNRLFEYQRKPRWNQLFRELTIQPVIDQIKEGLERLSKQKEESIASIPIIQKRINEIEKEIGEPITKFNKEKPDYVG